MMNLSPMLLVAIAAGGALGAISRYLVQQLFLIWFGSEFPWGTLVANVSGCLLIGILIGVWSNTGAEMSQEMRAFVVIGFLGAFTTFSAFSLDTVTLLQNTAYLKASLNIGLNLFASIGATFVGFLLARNLAPIA